MRPATEIKGNAQEALEDLRTLNGTTGEAERAELLGNVKKNLTEIVRLSTKIDARTGTSDPSTKPKTGSRSRPALGRGASGEGKTAATQE